MGLLFAAPLWRRKLTTLADLYRQRYSPSVERVAAIVLIPSSLLWAAAQIRAFGQVLVVSGVGLELEAALAIAACFVILYTTVGGLLADAFTDVLQAGVLTIGLVLLLVAVVNGLGGVGATNEVIAAPDRVPLAAAQEVGFLDALEAWTIPVLGSLVATELVSRVIAARSPNVARMGALAAGGAYLGIGLVAVVIGLTAGSLVGPLDDPEQLVPTAARALMSPWLYVIFAGGFLAAILSTVDSTLLVSAGLFSHNLLLRVVRVTDERVRVRISRATVASFGVIAYLIAQAAEGVSAIVELASALGSAGILVTVTFGLFTKSGGSAAAIATLVTGMASFVGATAAGARTPFLLSLAASLAVYVATGIAERRLSATPVTHA